MPKTLTYLLKLNERHTHIITFSLLGISTLLLAISNHLIGHHSAIINSTDFYGVSEVLGKDFANAIATIGFSLISVLSVFMAFNEFRKQQSSVLYSKVSKTLGTALVVTSVVALLPLFSASMWLEALGGFPAIGSGQGVIKYFALLSIGLYLLFPMVKRRIIQIFPVALVLLWIGGMKFTLFEAQGIETLVKTSPLMSWMYELWDLQTTSNIIGVYDLLAVILLVMSLFFPQLLIPAIALSGAVLVVTQTFLFSWSAALNDETILSTGGHFLIKDLWFIANLTLYWFLSQDEQTNHL